MQNTNREKPEALLESGESLSESKTSGQRGGSAVWDLGRAIWCNFRPNT